MSYPHHIIINHVSEVIRWEPITFHDNLIVHSVIVENYFPVNQIFKFGLSRWDQHSDDVGLAICDSLLDFTSVKPEAESVILGFLMLGASLLQAHLFQPVGGAKAVVGVPVLYEGITKLLVDVQPFRLFVGWVWALQLPFLLGFLALNRRFLRVGLL